MTSKALRMMAVSAAAPFAFIIMFAGMLTFGGGSATNSSGGGGIGAGSDCIPASDAVSAGDDGSASATGGDRTALRLAQEFADRGYSRESTAGMLANIQAESGFRADAVNASSGAYGLGQWLPSSKIRTWLDSHGHGDMDIASEDAQILMLADGMAAGDGWNNYYIEQFRGEGYRTIDDSLYETWKRTDDPRAAAVAWMDGYERPGHTTAEARKRAEYAASWYENVNGIEFTGKPQTDDAGDDAGTRICPADGEGDAETGSVGGAPAGSGDFSWMCDSNQHVCRNGDAGVFYPHLYGYGGYLGYQCVWYAWNRLAMIHGNDGWSWVVGDGGDIADNCKGVPGWEVDTTPHPGDGASGKTQPFAYTTHVAVVEEVADDPSGWKVRISEGNADGSASFDSYGSRWLTKTDMRGIQFFRNTAWR